MKLVYSVRQNLLAYCKAPLNLALILILALFWSQTQSAAAQTKETGDIAGSITTNEGTPAQGVTVKLKEKSKVTTTNSAGGFEFKNLPFGKYTIEIAMMGYESTSKDLEISSANPFGKIEFKLNASSQNLEEVVIQTGGNRFAKKESDDVAKMPLKNIENAQVYTVVSKELMKEQIVTDYNSAFKNVPGAGVAEIRNQGRTTSMSRGFPTPQVVRNGVGSFTYSTVDPVNLERIEVIKGPSATLFGSTLSSFGGLFNRVTKKPFETFKGEVSYSAASYDLNRLTIDINTPLNEGKTALLRVNSALHSERSFQDAGFSKNYMIAPSFSYAINDRLTLLVDVELSAYKATSPTRFTPAASGKARSVADLQMPYKLSFANNTVNYTTQQYNIFTQLKYKISDQWTSQTIISRTRSSSEGYVVALTGLTDSTLRQQVTYQDSPFYGTDIQQNFIGEFKIGKMRNRIVAGLDYYNLRAVRNDAIVNMPALNFRKPGDAYNNFNLQRVQPLFANTAIPITNIVSNNEETYSAYVSDVFNVTDRLLLMAGLRVDRYINNGTFTPSTNLTAGNYKQTAFSPRFGLVYQVLKDKLSVFGNYMNGFSNVGGSDFNGNTFKPQQANQFEGGVKFDMSKITATLSYYDMRVTNVTYQDPDPNHANFSVQDGTQLSRGIEAEIIANPFPGLNIVAGYTYNNSKFTKNRANMLGLRPATAGSPTYANIWASYRLVKGQLQGLGIGFGGIYGSESFQTNTTTFAFTIPSYVVLDASLFYDRPKFRIGLKVDNLTNEKYYSFRLAAQTPTRITGNITLKF